MLLGDCDIGLCGDHIKDSDSYALEISPYTTLCLIRRLTVGAGLAMPQIGQCKPGHRFSRFLATFGRDKDLLTKVDI